MSFVKKTTEEICRISQISKIPCVSFLKHPVHNIRLLVKTKQTKNTAMNHCSLTVCWTRFWKRSKSLAKTTTAWKDIHTIHQLGHMIQYFHKLNLQYSSLKFLSRAVVKIEKSELVGFQTLVIKDPYCTTCHSRSLLFRSSRIFVFWYFGHFSCVIFFPVFFHLAHLALQKLNKDYIIFL